MKKVAFMLMLITGVLLFVFSCTNNPVTGENEISLAKDDHGSGGNPNSGTVMGEDYGDLYIVYRDINGAPITTWIDDPHDESEDPAQIEVLQPIAFIGVIEGEDPVFQTDEWGFPVEAYPLEDWGVEYYVMYWGADEVLLHDDPSNLGVVASNVEFGRKSIARAPQHVLDQAFEEAVKVLNAPNNLSIDYCGRLVGQSDGEPKTIDSPRENMALYQELMKHNGYYGGRLELEVGLVGKLEALGNAPYHVTWMDVAASCFAAASDKTDNVLIDEIVYTNTILEINTKDDEGNITYYDYSSYTYDRERYADRCISRFLILTDTTYTTETLTILDAAEVNEYFQFTGDWPGNHYDGLSNIAGFRTAVDDAIQVLDFIHGDSNIIFEGFNACDE